MEDSFYWYDLETTGKNPKWDRIIQFAGIRTDRDLSPLGDPDYFFIPNALFFSLSELLLHFLHRVALISNLAPQDIQIFM